GGYRKGKGSREPLGALLVGYWEKEKLQYASHVGSGFDERSLAQVMVKLEPLRRKSCPFAANPELPNPTSWVEPELVAEVRFQSWTDDGHLRAPVFLRLRDDVDAKEVRRTHAAATASPPKAASSEDRAAKGEIGEILEQLESGRSDLALAVGPHRIPLTHLDRVYWPPAASIGQPGLTNRHLPRYFRQVSAYILPHLSEPPRPLDRP